MLALLLGGPAFAPRAQLNAQQVPPPEARAVIQQAIQQPGVVDQLRRRLQESGMTADQIRARLRSSGYPANLLDAYIGAGTPGMPAAAPSASALAAVQALGLQPISLQFAELPVDTGLVNAIEGAGDQARRSNVFGVDVFRRTTTQFLPLLSGPVPPDYRLGPGDNLVLIITGDVELAYNLPVTREGFIVIPQVGQVHVANLTMEQLRDLLMARLRRVYSGVRTGPDATTHFDVSVANVRANQVYVVGEVGQPGAYQISSLGTALTSIYAAGGLTERANMRAIEVRRNGQPVATLDLYDYLLRGDTRNDIRLETGDVIFVPVHGVRAQVSGAVVRPAIYELGQNETLADLMRASGGFRPDALLHRVVVHRYLPAVERGPGPMPRAAIDVQVAPGNGDGAVGGVVVPSLRLEDGDSVVVDSVPPLTSSLHVAITGQVRTPGRFPWRPGMTVRSLVRLAGGPAVGADLREAEVARLPADRSAGQLAVTFRVPLDSTYLLERDSAGRYLGAAGVAFPGGAAQEVALEPFDNVLILRQPDFELQRTVVLDGEVQFPGNYVLKSKSEKVAELVERAGGLTARAYVDGVRFFRRLDQAGRINVDLARALRDSNSDENVILQPGDSIVIPEYTPSVRVEGAVNSPASVLYVEGAGLGYYIANAGGYARNADKRRVSVRYANGTARVKSRFLFFSSSPKPGPGSSVQVPVIPTDDRTDVRGLIADMTQIVATLATVVIVALRP